MKRFLLALALATTASPLAAADLFYLDLMRDGTHAYDRGDFPLAIRHLRLACFGMLDEPKLLGECLARLALAQDKGKDVSGFRETFGRLVELEERFQGYSQSALPPESRTALEQRMAALIPPPTLATTPQGLRGGLATRKPDVQASQKPSRAPAPKPQSEPPQPIERSAAPQPQPSPPPEKAVEKAPEKAPEKTPEKTAPAAVAPATAPPPAPPSGEPATAEKEKKQLEKARQILAETSNMRQLREAFQLSREVADAHPEQRATQQLAGEAAYRISRWGEAADYLGRAGGPGDDQPELLFYLAVALYESGNPKAAAEPLRRALPNLQRTPYIDGYSRKILGQ